MRLERFVALTVGVSRKAAAAFIKDGRVVERDGRVFFDGKELLYKENIYIIMNKSAGYVCENGRENSVFSLLPKTYSKRNLSVCGRLDKDTEGLLLISDDGDFVHRIISPKKHLKKRYFVRLQNPAKLDYQKAFADGLAIDNNDVCKPAELTISDNKYEVYVTLTEGKYHQIKRMFAAVNNEVTYLKRIQTGGLLLPESLSPGSSRELTDDEIKLIFLE
jgi:16S rRNA pseudouridine516 synthase